MKEKKVNKSIIYITTMILLVVLTLSSIGLAAWAMLKTKLDIGGNVSFNGTGNIQATVSNGRLNEVEQSGIMTGFVMDEDYDEPTNAALSTWKGLNLEFDEEGNEIYLTFTITNNHSTKTLLVEMTSNCQSNDNINMEVLALGQPYEERVLIAPSKSVEYLVIFSLESTDQAGTLDNFSVSLNMRNAKESELPVPTLDKLDFRLLSNDTYEVSAVDISEIMEEIVIPATHNGKNVTRIASDSGLGIAKSVIMPDTIIEIGSMGFECLYSKGITIPDSVKKIEDSAFADSDTLKSIVIGSGVENMNGGFFYSEGSDLVLKYIKVAEDNQHFCSENGVLYNKDKTTLVRFPTSRSVTSFNIPESVTEIGYYSFGDCKNLTHMIIPSTVTIIGERAFQCCANLTNITFGQTSGTIEMEHSVFYNVPTTATVNFSGATWTCGSEVYSDANPPASLSVLEGTDWDAPKVWTITKP